MIDKIILAPYYWTLRFRHFLYDSGIRKQYRCDVPVISVGNVTVGGTGKTPHTEMLIEMLSSMHGLSTGEISVLSRGYKRKSKGFQIVDPDGSVALYGDEPLQIKRKFPETIVAVDKSRVEGCKILSAPEHNAKVIILDDGFQHRAIKPHLSIVLVDFSRPIFKDRLIPLGRLRDIPERIHAADVVIVTKCPSYLDEWERSKWAEALEIHDKQHLFFTSIDYCTPQAIFPEGDVRYLHSPRLILFSGIANDKPLAQFLSDTYKIVKRFSFRDHRNFSRADIRAVFRASKGFPTALVATTEKDSQRISDIKGRIPDSLKKKMFRVPIKISFLTKEDADGFRSIISSVLTESRSESAPIPRG